MLAQDIAVQAVGAVSFAPSRTGFRRFGLWTGLSGCRYPVTMFPWNEVPDFCDSLAFAVRRVDGRAPEILAAADLGPLPGLATMGSTFTEAAAAGATEWHVHLLAPTRAARQAVIDDITARRQSGSPASAAPDRARQALRDGDRY